MSLVWRNFMIILIKAISFLVPVMMSMAMVFLLWQVFDWFFDCLVLATVVNVRFNGLSSFFHVLICNQAIFTSRLLLLGGLFLLGCGLWQRFAIIKLPRSVIVAINFVIFIIVIREIVIVVVTIIIIIIWMGGSVAFRFEVTSRGTPSHIIKVKGKACAAKIAKLRASCLAYPLSNRMIRIRHDRLTNTFFPMVVHVLTLVRASFVAEV